MLRQYELRFVPQFSTKYCSKLLGFETLKVEKKTPIILVLDIQKFKFLS